MFLEQALGSEARIKILRTLFQEALPQLDAASLARETGKSLAGVHKALSEVEAAGVVVSHQRGRTAFFAANGAHPWFEALQTLFREERTRHNVPHLFPTYWNLMESVVSRFAKARGVRVIAMYGSLTRPPIYPDADIDLLVGFEPPGRPPPLEARILGHRVSMLAIDIDSLEEKVRKKDPFVAGALERHVVLYQAPGYEAPWLRRRIEPSAARRRHRRGGLR